MMLAPKLQPGTRVKFKHDHTARAGTAVTTWAHDPGLAIPKGSTATVRSVKRECYSGMRFVALVLDVDGIGPACLECVPAPMSLLKVIG